jgi:hypothetical protein
MDPITGSENVQQLKQFDTKCTEFRRGKDKKTKGAKCNIQDSRT